MIYVIALLTFAALAWLFWEIRKAPSGEENGEGYGPVSKRED